MLKLEVAGKCTFKDGKFSSVLSTVPLGELVDENLLEIPNLDEEKRGKTYQREKIRKKVKDISKEIISGKSAKFQPIILNSRRKPEVKNIRGIQMNIKKVVFNSQLQCVDGQQRIEGMRLALKDAQEKGLKEIENIDVPVVISNDSIKDELHKFTNLNGKQTSIAGGHISHVIYDNIVKNNAQNYGNDEKLAAIVAGMALKLDKEEGGSLYGRIKRPGTDNSYERSMYQTKITTFNTAFNFSNGKITKELLKLGDKVIRPSEVEKLAEKLFTIVSPFWKALKKSHVEIWDRPADYVLYKNIFISSMALLLVDIRRTFGNKIKWNEKDIYLFISKSKSFMRTRNWESRKGKYVKEGHGRQGYSRICSEILFEIKDNYDWE